MLFCFQKVHPNRVTLVQKIYNMRNRNRIDVCFTKPLSEVNNYVQRLYSLPVDIWTIVCVTNKLFACSQTENQRIVQCEIAQKYCAKN